MRGAAGTADFFYREAQRPGYVARSAFKIQRQHKLIAPGAAVLDLGCAPGAWLQVACQNLGPLDKGGVCEDPGMESPTMIQIYVFDSINWFEKFCKEKFKKVSWLRPKATRSSSREIFMICEGLRQKSGHSPLERVATHHS